MTLKYESEILFDLMKRDGDDTPSDVLPYESELKEKYLEQVEGAYPKLQDYRSEWLNYNLNAHLPADFPVESVSNVTNATFENVVPYAYGSAILSGNTLVNCVDTTVFSKKSDIVSRSDDGIITIPSKNGSYIYAYGKKSSLFKPSTNYTLFLEIMEFSLSDGGLEILNPNSTIFTNAYTAVHATGYKKILLTTKDDISDCDITLRLQTHPNANDGEVVKVRYMILEGDYTNVDIPYFEGMTSVKMPVLTTTGKNLFDGKWEIGSIGNNNGLEIGGTSNVRSVNYINVEPNTTYIASSTQLQHANVIAWYAYDKNKNFISSSATSRVFKTPSNCEFIRARTFDSDSTNMSLDCVLQIEQGSIATSYEPYKSNILTVNGEITLRGIGEVRDELDLLTGEVVECIGEIVLDGNRGYTYSGDHVANDEYVTFHTHLKENQKPSTIWEISVSDKMEVSNEAALGVCTKECIYPNSNFNVVYIRVKKSHLVEVSPNGFKKWIADNVITLQYKLATESIKTVDLNIQDQDGNTSTNIRPIEGTMHVSTSSQTLPPLLDMSVPIEATSQNLMSFANIVEEE